MTGGGGQVGQRTIYEVNYQRKKQSPTTQGGSCHSSALLQDRGQGGRARNNRNKQSVSNSDIAPPLLAESSHPTNGRNPSSLNLHTLICSASE